jgi:peptidoglycan/LPS O-acetylase OafA/YrhL
METNKKLNEIQILRCIAIGLVVLFHFFVRKADLLPFQDTYRFWPLTHGWIGVELFFIISGFVISYTTKFTLTLRDYFINRISRIYPALIVALPLVYIVQKHIPYSPYTSISTLPNLLFSIFMFPPNIINIPLDTSFNWITLVLWSLKIELFFYFIFGLLFFKFGLYHFQMFTSLTVLGFLLDSFDSLIHQFHLGLAADFSKMIGMNYFIWFYLGMLFYKVRFENLKKKYLYGAQAILVAKTFLVFSSFEVPLSTLCVILIANLLILGKKRIFHSRNIFVLVGDVSYELYLIHQGIGLTLLIYIFNVVELNILQSFICSIFIIAICVWLSFLMKTRILEDFSRWLKQKLQIWVPRSN